VVVTGYDDRSGCGYVLRTGADIEIGADTVVHRGMRVSATTELAALLRDALQRHPFLRPHWKGPEVPLTLDDPTVLAWLQTCVGGVLTVSGGPSGARSTHR